MQLRICAGVLLCALILGVAAPAEARRHPTGYDCLAPRKVHIFTKIEKRQHRVRGWTCHRLRTAAAVPFPKPRPKEVIEARATEPRPGEPSAGVFASADPDATTFSASNEAEKIVAVARLALPSEAARPVLAPLTAVGNLLRDYFASLVRPASSAVHMTCPDGRPFPRPLQAVLRRAAWEFDGQVEVISGYRSLSHNRAVYGNRRSRRGGYTGDGSQHIRCKAADIRVAGVPAGRLHAWALRQPELGGVGRYRGDFIHVDVRPRVKIAARVGKKLVMRSRIVTWDWRGKRTRYTRHHRARAADHRAGHVSLVGS